MEAWIPMGWQFASNTGLTNGRIVLIWNEVQVDVKLLKVEEQVIMAEVLSKDNGKVFRIAFVYGSNSRARRNMLWADLKCLIHQSEPWLIQGDFNVTRRIQDRSPQSGLTSGMEDFNQCIREMDCEEPANKGHFFTWSTTRGEGPIRKSRIDRALINSKWLEEFGPCFAQAHFPGISDHCPIVLSPDQIKRVNVPFRFFNFWANHPSFGEMVRSSWTIPISGTKMFQVSKKLMFLKKELQKLDKKVYSRIGKRVVAARDRVQGIQKRLLGEDCGEDIREEEKVALEEYRKLCCDEEIFAKQKSRQTWLSLGDKNTNFFYKKCSLRGMRNRVIALKTGEGELIEGQTAIMGEAIRFFNQLLGPHSSSQCDTGLINRLVSRRLTEEQKQGLSLEVTDEDIKRVVFAMSSDKSPGPDGFNAYFFKATWAVTGNLVSEAVHEFFRNGRMLKQWNSTVLTLLPKTLNPQNMNDFRPISCCNVVYKIISKILANKLKNVLSDIVGLGQSAFIPGRSISHNILLMQGLLRGYARKRISPRVAFKIDIRKAFDSVKWDTLKALMIAFDFPRTFVCRIAECLSTVHFIVKLNGMHDGFFKSTCGVRQGDPISPYLFVLLMEILNCIIKMQLRTDSFHFHPFCSDLAITHVCFADDLFLLARADEESIIFLKKALTTFSRLTGLHINFSKSLAFFGGISAETQERLSGIMGINIGKLPVKYLGVPLITGQLHIAHCKPLLDKLKDRLQGWAVQKLSYAGRLELARSTFAGIINYWSQQFALPKKVMREADKITRRFIWGTGSCKVSWKKICTPKPEGGLGLKSAAEWNSVLLIRQLWDITRLGSSLWVKWVHSRFIKSQSIWNCNINSRMSWSLQKVLRARDRIGKLCLFKIGNGRSISFWNEPWLNGEPIIKEAEFCGRYLDVRCKNASLFDVVEGEWNELLLESAKGRQILEVIQLIQLQPDVPDVVQWKMEVNGSIKARDIWETMRTRTEDQQWCKLVWAKKGIPRHQFILWLVFLERLMTRDRLVKIGVSNNAMCPLCGVAAETLDHIFFSCSFSALVWTKVAGWTLQARIPMIWSQIREWAVLHLLGNSFQAKVLRLWLGAAVYEIWRCRNLRVFKGVVRTSEDVFEDASAAVRAVVHTWKGVPATEQNWMICLHWNFNHQRVFSL